MKKPEFLVFNVDQSVAFIAAQDDVLFVNQNIENVLDQEIDVDNNFLITDVKACLFYNKKFYVLANKFEKMRGVFLLMIDESNLTRLNRKNFIIKWNNQLEIGDADIYIVNDGACANNECCESPSKTSDNNKSLNMS